MTPGSMHDERLGPGRFSWPALRLLGPGDRVLSMRNSLPVETADFINRFSASSQTCCTDNGVSWPFGKIDNR